ncbi:MAG: HDOD domain-containing protein [Bryobacteraceae bacterium]|jgi:HD-like signal output (HDOD) protein
MTTQDPLLAQTHKPWAVARLRPFPPVAAKLLRVVAIDNVVFHQVAELIRVDAVFSAEVLRLANSPLLGCRREVVSILHAMALLGLERLKSLVLMVALRNHMAGALQDPSLLRCWRHSLASAFLCQDLGAACWLDKDQCYTAGLMHDVGRLALLASFPGDYSELLRSVDASGSDLLEAERARFEIDHCAVGCWLITEWDLPEDFLPVVGTHHAELCGGKFDVAAATRVACRMADVLGFQAAGPPPSITLAGIADRLPEPARARWEEPDAALVELAGNINAVECSLL